jgi:hypothetical protein
MVDVVRVRLLSVEEAEASTLEIPTPMKMQDMLRDPNYRGRYVSANARAKRRIRVDGKDRMAAFARWM